MLHVSYKTAWYMCHRIRAAMRDDLAELLRGVVEMDETYMGADTRDWRQRKALPKVTVVGAVEREGRVRVRISDHGKVNKADVYDFLAQFVAPDAEAIYTDSAQVYHELGDEDTRHEAVNHSIGQWVQADVHTNTIESVWSLFKRSVVGSYHHLSVKHLPAYLDEMAFRYNNRENAYLFRDTLLRLVDGETMQYADLIAG
jgi:transposase-like protein